MQLSQFDRDIADALASLPGVVAVAVGGSRATGVADERSDTDLYALWRGELAAPADRAAVLAPLADQGQVVSASIFGPEDHLHRDHRLVEVVYLNLDEMQQLVATATHEGLGGTVCSTAFLHTLATCQPLRDDAHELAAVKRQLAGYPEPTRTRILADSTQAIPEFISQLRTAQARRDVLMIVDRRAAAQAALVNLLFALNRTYHPGEKRLLWHTARLPRRVSDQDRRFTELAIRPPLDPELADIVADLYTDILSLG